MLKSKRIGARRKNQVRNRLLANSLEQLEDRRLMAVTQSLVQDINQNSAGNFWSPQHVTPVGSKIFFTASTPTAGTELWVTNGTTAGTSLVKDIIPGSNSSHPTNLVDVNGTLFFSANSQLWKSDGTAAGTTVVSNTVTSAFDLANANGVLYFRGSGNSSHNALWKSDGTPGGTVRVANIAAPSEYPKNIVAVGSTVYFTGYDYDNGYELWKSDGTDAGTMLVRNIAAGSTGSYPENLTNLNGTLVFTATDNSGDRELWKSDGTSAGTVLIKNIYTGTYGSNPSDFLVVGSKLFFSANDSSFGRELWTSDGTTANTNRVKDIYVGSSSNPTYLTNVDGTVYFSAADAQSGNDLWKSDGTSAGTVRVKTLGSSGLYPQALANGNGTLYFFGYDQDTGYELWKSNGTSAGTTLVKDIVPGSSGNYSTAIAAANGVVALFTGSKELWVTDGSSAGTVPLKSFAAATTGSGAEHFVNANGTLYLAAAEGFGTELWKSNGSSAGTVRVGNSGVTGSYIKEATEVNGTIFYVGWTPTTGYELWKSDGTAAGTTIVKNIRSGADSSNPRSLTNVNGKLMFVARDDTTGYELWTSDGTSAGTVRVKDIMLGADQSSSPENLTNINGTLFFSASDGAGSELWKSDGTPAGTVLVKDILPGGGGSHPRDFTSFNGEVFFSAQSNTGRDLWKTNGTSAGTLPVRNSAAPGYYQTSAANLANVGGVLYFSGRSSGDGYELWKSDGTDAGTVLVKNVNTNPYYGSYPSQFTEANGTIFFVTDYWFSSTKQLWKTDGTSGGTQLVKDIAPSQLLNVNGTLFLAASDGTSSDALWTSDGTNAGTVLAEHSGTSQRPLDVNNLIVVDNHLFFSGMTDLHGREVFRYNTVAEAFNSSLTTDEDVQATTGNVLATVVADGPTTLAFDSSSAQGGTVIYNGDGTFTYSPAANFSGSDSFTYTVTDFDGEQATATVSITVNPLNDLPTNINLSSSSIAENQASGSTVGTFTTTDEDLGDTFTYTLVGGTGSTDNASFIISGNSLQTAASFNFEAKSSYSIRVRTTDSGSATFEKVFTISVTNVNEAPTVLALSATSIDENQPSGSTVGTFSTTDPDAGESFTYALIAGTGSTDNGSFTIDGNALKTNASFNFEAKSSYSIRVRTTDSGGLVRVQVFTITVNNLNEAPTNITLSSTSIAENLAAGSVVGTLSTTDDDAGESFTYALVSGTGSTGNSSFTLVGNTLQTNASFDAEAQSSYSIRVRTTDSANNVFVKVFTITVLNVNEDPTALNLSANSVNENEAAGTVVGTFSTTDTDNGDSFTYTFATGAGAGNNGSFTIAGNTLKTAALFNFETKSSYTIRVRTTDSGGKFIEQAFTISVIDTNDAPVLNITPSPILPGIQEDATNPGGVLITTLLGNAVSDADAGALKGMAVISAPTAHGTWQYSLNGGSSWNSLAAATNTSAILLPSNPNARIRFVPALNFNGTTSFLYRAWDQTAGAIGGVLNPVDHLGGTKSMSTAVESASITVVAVNDAPVLNTTPSPKLVDISEDAMNTAGALVTALLGSAVTDPDAGALKGMAVTSAPTATGTWQYSLNGGSSWNSLAAASNTSAILLPSNPTTRVRFVPALNFNGTTSFAYRAWDQTAGSAGGTLNSVDNRGGTKSMSTALESASITVVAVNDAPILNIAPDPTLPTILEDAVNSAGVRISSLLGTAVTDPDAGALKGIAVISAPVASGSWEYSLDNGSTWKSLAAASNTAAILLPSTSLSRIRFIPKLNFNGTAKIIYRAWDQTAGTAEGTLNPGPNSGGTKSISAALESASITVTPVNDPPSISGISGAIGYVRGTSAPVAVAPAALVTDVDTTTLTNGKLTVRISTGAHGANRLTLAGTFSINASNQVLQGTTVIGSLATVNGVLQDGIGARKLTVQFNAAATVSTARILLRSIRFSTVGGIAGTRSLLFSLSEGDGKTSSEVEKTVNVT